MKLVEGHIDTLRAHIDLLDNSLIEKHKAVVQEVRSVEDSVRGLRADIDMVKDLTERIAKRLEELASREQVKILERYVSLWQPLNFVTRSEVETVVKNILADIGVKIKVRE
jgi:hemerythrin-like domain-containing protein